MDKQTVKALRDQCIQEWSFASRAVPSWLRAQQQLILDHCQQQPVHGLTFQWLTPIIQLRQFLADKGHHTQLVKNQQAVSAIADCLAEINAAEINIHDHLMKLRPWRKGPWCFNDINIQSEWNSSLKYQRLQVYGPSVRGKTILDIGSGNGYYGFRMLGDGAAYVLGVDPAPLFWAQFQTFLSVEPVACIDMLPVAGEPLMDVNLAFDLVLSMGVLYHRRNPLDHLKLLKHCLREDGELVLETLVIDGPDSASLMPTSTYAGMRNVYSLPSVGLLQQWLKVAGFHSIECVSLSLTSDSEQQRTPWIATQTLEDFLSPCGQLTKEGYPRPWRAMIRAKL